VLSLSTHKRFFFCYILFLFSQRGNFISLVKTFYNLYFGYKAGDFDKDVAPMYAVYHVLGFSLCRNLFLLLPKD
ncbi:hypothetical protein L9F63_002327, partial [Diploptera punctata]